MVESSCNADNFDSVSIFDGELEYLVPGRQDVSSDIETLHLSKAMVQACSAFCITLVSCAAGIRVSFSRAFASHTLALSQKAETDDDHIRWVMLSLGTAFTVFMSSWPGFRDMGIRVSAVDILGHLSLVITRDLFLSNADTLFTIFVGLLAKQGVRDDRLGALLVLRKIINWRSAPHR